MTVPSAPPNPASPPPPPDHPGTLTESQKRTLELAQKRRRTLERAAGVAAFNGWSLILFAALTLLFSQTPLAIAVTLLFAFAGYRELRGRKQLRQFNPAGPNTLAYNQLLIALVVTAYCAWCILSYLYLAPADLSEINNLIVSQQDLQYLPSLKPTVQLWEQRLPYLIAGLYGLVILISLIIQGLTALYYLSRRTTLEAYLADTPPWVRELQQTLKP